MLDDAQSHRQDGYDGYWRSNGDENPYRLAAELSNTMWNYCGIWRLQKDLLKARSELDDLSARIRQCKLLDGGTWVNQTVPFTRNVAHMIEVSKAIVGGAIVRDESRGAHFKLDTPARDDDKWLHTTKASWTEKGPEFDLTEKIECNVIAPRARKYKVNQNMIVRKIMGEDFFERDGVQHADEVTKS